MSAMPAFSRLQLAAALIEYDNDPDDMARPRKSAYDSAIFAHLRRANGNIHATAPEVRNQDFLGVKLPSDSGALSETDREVYVGKERSRRSKLSVDMLHNPFGEDQEEEAEEEEQPKEDSDLEVDLKSWGLDSIIPEEKRSKKDKKGKGKAKSEIIPNTVGVGLRPPKEDRPAHARTVSMPFADFGEGGPSMFRERRNTISDPLSLNEMGVLDVASDSRRFASHPLVDDMPARRPLDTFSRDTIPFPADKNASDMNLLGGDNRPASRMSSTLETKSQFAIPPPPPSRASRFDPKYQAHVRAQSNATQLSIGTTQLPYAAGSDENAVRAPSRASALEVNPRHDRRMSTFTMRTQDMLNDNDFQSEYQYPIEEMPSRERRYSRMDLMRPKILVMPSPLQNAVAPPPTTIKSTPRGFIDSSDARPLPAGAKSNRLSVLGPSAAANVPVPSNSFTPNPRLSLSASQLLFRNNLLVDGQRDVTYNDIDGSLKRAKEDGQQVKLEFPNRPILPEVEVINFPPEEQPADRPAGKIYGRSLIDDLEARKTEMKNKKRVFTGDQRPSMMDRGLTRSSTLIDPSSLPARPTSMRMPSSQTDASLSRSGSRGNGPLLAMDSSGNINETAGVWQSRLANTRSVFGVDTLWQREMAKLKDIEEQEKIEAEEKRKREEELELKMSAKKKKGKKKGKTGGIEESKSVESLVSPASPASAGSVPSASAVSPAREVSTSLTLPNIPVVTSRRRAIPEPDDDDESDGESSASEAGVKRVSGEQDKLADQWVSDDEKPALPASVTKANVPQITVPGDDSEDEDVPLSVALQKAAQRKSMSPQAANDDDSDEDRPLSMLLLNKADAGSASPNLGDLVNFDSKPSLSLPKDDDDEDDVPLGIRASRLPAGASQLSFPSSQSGANNADEDDRPLSMHPGQIRKSQFNLFSQFQQQQQAQQQIQQQQMLQAQMAGSMGFSGHQSMMFMMPPTPFTPQPQMPVVVPPQQPNKFTSVDRWRHDVAVEGD